MEEKKQIKVSLGTVFLVIAIILIVVMGALLYMQKTESDRKIAELENIESKFQKTINDLQGKIDNISNTTNSNDETDIIEDNQDVNVESNQQNVSTNNKADESENNTSPNNQENINKCYTNGETYWLMLYSMNLNNLPERKGRPLEEQKAFCLMVNTNVAQQEVYGTYRIENDKITLVIPSHCNYNYVNNTVNMETYGSKVEVKDEGGVYRITLDYSENVIKYGAHDLKLQSN